MGALIHFLVAGSFFIASVQDIRTREIPDRVHLLLLIAGVAGMLSGAINWQDALFSFGVMAALSVVLAYIGMLGGGDMKLLTAAALPLGLPASIHALLAASILMGLHLLVLIAMKKEWRKRTVPFAPFFSVGYAIVATNVVAILN